LVSRHRDRQRTILAMNRRIAVFRRRSWVSNSAKEFAPDQELSLAIPIALPEMTKSGHQVHRPLALGNGQHNHLEAWFLEPEERYARL
jgi:hypothetical protein